jgi:hypothetical protein
VQLRRPFLSFAADAHLPFAWENRVAGKLKFRVKRKTPAPPKVATSGRIRSTKVYSPSDTGVDAPLRVLDTISAMHARR